ncbi:MAG: DUF2974 domain-containing protein [Clostridia bacterium]|nr:DUF2974 domain-containing protein [Clostridia bacterium]
MSNLIDYLKWRGDLPLSRDPLNKIDCLLFAQLSYIQWELVWNKTETAHLSDLYSQIESLEYAVTFTAKSDRIMLPLAAGSTRFGAVPLSDLVTFFDEAAGEQFAAVTFHLPDGSLFIAFRGTDCSLVGWREDFRMACQPEVPAQRHAADYLNHIAGKYTGCIRIAGHSKGGNLAVYAAAVSDERTRSRISDIYSFDGPGQSAALVSSHGYNCLTGMHTIVPVSSIIGMLMEHPSVIEIVESNASSILQHDPYSWQLCGTDFVYAKDRNADSLYFESVFRKWLSEISYEERSAFVDTLFDVFASTKAHAFGNEFFDGLRQHPINVLESLQSIDKETWQKVSKVINALAGSAIENGIASSPIGRLTQALSLV